MASLFLDSCICPCRRAWGETTSASHCIAVVCSHPTTSGPQPQGAEGSPRRPPADTSSTSKYSIPWLGSLQHEQKKIEYGVACVKQRHGNRQRSALVGRWAHSKPGKGGRTDAPFAEAGHERHCGPVTLQRPLALAPRPRRPRTMLVSLALDGRMSLGLLGLLGSSPCGSLLLIFCATQPVSQSES